ncbi:MAG: hypothetical protein WD045_17005 [Pirellulaceae bacterium]
MRRSIVITVAAGLALASTGAILLSDGSSTGHRASSAAHAETPGRLNPEPGATPLAPKSSRFGNIQLTSGQESVEPARLNAEGASPIPVATASTPSSYTQLTAAEGEQPKSSRRYVPTATTPPNPATAASPVTRQPAPAPSRSGLPANLDDAISRLKSGTPAPSPAQAPAPPAAESRTPAPSPARFGPSAWQAAGQRPASNGTEVPSVATRPEREDVGPVANGAARLSTAPVPEPPAVVDSEPATEQPASTSRRFAPSTTAPETPRFNPSSGTPSGTVQTTRPQVGNAAPSPAEHSTSNQRLFAVSSPTVSIETIGPKAIVLGKPSTYRLVAKNSGTADARQISVNLVVPDNVEVASANASVGNAQVGSPESPLTWQIPVLPGGSGAELELEVIAHTSRHFELGANVIYSEMLSSASIAVLEPKLSLAIEGPRDMRYGETSLFKLVATNTGTGPAEEVSITIMPIKEGQEPTTIDTIGTIAARQNKVIELELTAKQAGTLRIDAQTTASGDLKADARHQVMVRRAKLELAASGPSIRYAATEAEFQLSLRNRGDAEARNVEIEAQLPEGARFVKASEGGRLDEANRRIVWQLNQLAMGAELDLQATCVLETEGENQLIAKVTSEGESELSHRVTTRVESVADLTLDVSDPKGPIPVGEEVTYEFKLVNRGTKAAQGVRLSVRFAESMVPTSIVGGEGAIDTHHVRLEPIAQIGPGEERIVQVKAKAAQQGNHVFRTEVVCEDSDIKLAAEQTTRFYGNSIEGRSQTLEARHPAPITPPTSRFR